MKIGSLVKSGFKSIWGNKLRSFLTLLGILIGVASVIAMVAVGEGTKLSVTESFLELGPNLISVHPAFNPDETEGMIIRTSRGLTISDADNLRQLLPGIREISPLNRANQTAVYYNVSRRSALVGSYANYQDLRNHKVEKGRFFTDFENSFRKKVVVLGSEIADELFGEYIEPVGEQITLGRTVFEVIGVMEEKGNTTFENMNQNIHLPINTFNSWFSPGTEASQILISMQEGIDMAAFKENLDYQMLMLHGNRRDFEVHSLDEIIKMISQSFMAFTILLSSIAFISLLVGGIGIMNIMLVTVTERTQEIGVRRAVGARRIDIMFQFLLEAVILTTSGGILGIIAGVTLAEVVSAGMTAMFQTTGGGGGGGGFSASVPLWSILVSFGFSAGIGLIFGLWPAYKAARLDPVDALRSL